MTHEELELLADIRDSTTLFDVILRFETSEWLESSIKCDFAIFSLDLAFHNFAFFKHSFWCKNKLSYLISILLLRYLSYLKSILLAYFCDSRKQNFYICDP